MSINFQFYLNLMGEMWILIDHLNVMLKKNVYMMDHRIVMRAKV